MYCYQFLVGQYESQVTVLKDTVLRQCVNSIAYASTQRTRTTASGFWQDCENRPRHRFETIRSKGDFGVLVHINNYRPYRPGNGRTRFSGSRGVLENPSPGRVVLPYVSFELAMALAADRLDFLMGCTEQCSVSFR
jgi:hypothetical protein